MLLLDSETIKCLQARKIDLKLMEKWAGSITFSIIFHQIRNYCGGPSSELKGQGCMFCWMVWKRETAITTKMSWLFNDRNCGKSIWEKYFDDQTYFSLTDAVSWTIYNFSSGAAGEWRISKIVSEFFLAPSSLNQALVTDVDDCESRLSDPYLLLPGQTHHQICPTHGSLRR